MDNFPIKTRLQNFLANIVGQGDELEPRTRKEAILAKIAGYDVDIEPKTGTEYWLMKALENAGSSEPSYDVKYVSGGTNIDADAHTGLIFKNVEYEPVAFVVDISGIIDDVGNEVVVCMIKNTVDDFINVLSADLKIVGTTASRVNAYGSSNNTTATYTAENGGVLTIAWSEYYNFKVLRPSSYTLMYIYDKNSIKTDPEDPVSPDPGSGGITK